MSKSWCTGPEIRRAGAKGECLGQQQRLPHSRAFSDGLFKLRPRGKSGIGRVFYCFLVGQHVVVGHAFIKKSRQTPEREIKIARK